LHLPGSTEENHDKMLRVAGLEAKNLPTYWIWSCSANQST
jgi:hypothetical protein